MMSRRLGASIAVWILLGFAAPPEASAQRKPAYKLLTQEECRRLVLGLLKNEGASMDDPTLNLIDLPYDQSLPDFYSMEVWDADARGYYHHVGSFSVDERTGSVWDVVVCHEYKSKSLRELQRKIRKRLGISAEEYRKLRRPGPLCPAK
ncbi:MAG TPA: hypothetical protein VGS20_08745 [Candidatus Acidoferrales bacterium]|nr:hypothetical protein [Candidatus Acidoferrales bacterium]